MRGSRRWLHGIQQDTIYSSNTCVHTLIVEARPSGKCNVNFAIPKARQIKWKLWGKWGERRGNTVNMKRLSNHETLPGNRWGYNKQDVTSWKKQNKTKNDNNTVHLKVYYDELKTNPCETITAASVRLGGPAKFYYRHSEIYCLSLCYGILAK